MARNTHQKPCTHSFVVSSATTCMRANGVHTVNLLDTDDPRFGGFRHSLDASKSSQYLSAFVFKMINKSVY